MRRRAFASGISVGLASLAGCVASGGDEFDPDIESQYRRGGAPAERLRFEPHEPTVDLTPEDHEYDETDRVVSIDYRNTTGKMTFKEFGRTRSRRAVEKDLDTRLEQADSGNHGLQVSPVDSHHEQRIQHSDLDIDFEAYDVVMQVSHLTIFDGNSNLVYEPAVDFETVVNLVPASYDTLTTFGGYEYAASVAVICYRGTEPKIEEEGSIATNLYT